MLAYAHKAVPNILNTRSIHYRVYLQQCHLPQVLQLSQGNQKAPVVKNNRLCSSSCVGAVFLTLRPGNPLGPEPPSLPFAPEGPMSPSSPFSPGSPVNPLRPGWPFAPGIPRPPYRLKGEGLIYICFCFSMHSLTLTTFIIMELF